MKSMILNLLMAGFFMCSGILFSQEKKSNHSKTQPSPNGIFRCLSDEYNAGLLKKHPNMMGSSGFEKKLQNTIKNNKLSKIQSTRGATLVRIPVVVHVIHNGTAIGVGANISNAQVLSQIQVLNEDYRKMFNTRGYNSHPDGADTNIEFYLAREDPDCNPTTGIERYDLSSISTTWSSGFSGNTNDILKPLTIWDPSRYLNMWTVTFTESTDLGYAQFPGGPSDTDGVVMGYQYFGSNDASGVNLNSSAPYNLGRTTTHEVGHYLGLYHTFEGGCGGVGDQVSDTPPVNQANYGCPVGADSCPAAPDGILDMIENYMEYTDDSCMNIFTNGQSTRMDGVLSGARLSLANSTVPDTALPSVSYDSSIKIMDLNLDPCTGSFTPEVKLANYGTVTLTSATLSYNLNNGTPIHINWTGSLAEGSSEIINLPTLSTPSGNNNFNITVSQSNADQRSCNDTNSENFVGVSYESTLQVHLTLRTDNYASETSWEFKDSANTVLYNSPNYNNSNNNKTFNYDFVVEANECYTFTISDSEGDGICCEYGNGYYELKTDNNTLITSGGGFSSSESTVMSTTALGVGDFFETNKVKLYPNPTTSDMTIGLFNPHNLPDGYTIYNMLGQKVMSKMVSNPEDLTINTSIFSNGIYFIRLSKKNEARTIPFIKK
ncbi:M43 family zinc metalloprotease [Flavobacteriaceae bacterium LMO-SS05]